MRVLCKYVRARTEYQQWAVGSQDITNIIRYLVYRGPGTDRPSASQSICLKPSLKLQSFHRPNEDFNLQRFFMEMKNEDENLVFFPSSKI